MFQCASGSMKITFIFLFHAHVSTSSGNQCMAVLNKDESLVRYPTLMSFSFQALYNYWMLGSMIFLPYICIQLC